VIRDRGSLAREVEGGRIENVFRLQVMNMQERPRAISIEARGAASLGRFEVLVEPRSLDLPATSTRMIAVRVRAEPRDVHGSQPFEFVIRSPSPLGEGRAEGLMLIEKSRFLVP
jgi:polyferredoxin